MSSSNDRITICGLGSVGSSTADSLARLGYEDFILVDSDEVEAPNVRKSIYTLDHVDMKKTEALRAHLKAINPQITCLLFDRFIEELDDDMWDAILGCELIAEMADSRRGTEACVERLMAHYRDRGEQIPLVKMLSLDNIAAGLTMFWIPGSEKPCPCCLFRATPHINTSDQRQSRNDPDYRSDRITSFAVQGVLPDLHFGLSLTVSLIHALLFRPASDQAHSGRALQLLSLLEDGSDIRLWSPFRDPYLDWQLPEHMGRAMELRLTSVGPCPFCGRHMSHFEEE